jgi:serine/threonine-protein kinase CHEK1
LLDEDGNLKVSDFGLATIFKMKNKIRLLKTPCGSPPYLAPEIREMQYDGSQVDIWSCGIILFVLLVGNTAWGEPSQDDYEFMNFYEGYPTLINTLPPWNSLGSNVLQLLIGMLNIDPNSRFNMETIKSSFWFSM